MFVLISSNSENPNLGITSKKFELLEQELGCQIKAPQLTLEIDKVHLKQICDKAKRDLLLIQTSMHKKEMLKTKSFILSQLQKYFLRELDYFYFVFSGHGFANGDLCIQTFDHPQGERLTIQEIMDTAMKTKSKRKQPGWIGIFIDACYSGQNAERARRKIRQYTDSKDQRCFAMNTYTTHYVNSSGNKGSSTQRWFEYFQGPFTFQIFTSSGPEYTSLNTSFGGLLISKLWFEHFQDDQQRKKDLKKKFQKRKPLVCLTSTFHSDPDTAYKWSFIEDLKFD